jgi:hypothetical protein
MNDDLVIVHLEYTAAPNSAETPSGLPKVTELFGAVTDDDLNILERPWASDDSYWNASSMDRVPDEYRYYDFGILRDGVHAECQGGNWSGFVSCDVVVPKGSDLWIDPHLNDSPSGLIISAILGEGSLSGSFKMRIGTEVLVWDIILTPETLSASSAPGLMALAHIPA